MMTYLLLKTAYLEDSRTNASDIIDYVISSTAIYNKIEKLSLNNDFSSDHSAILVNFLTNIHCVKSVRIWRFSGLYFPAFGLITESSEHLTVFIPNAGKYGPEKFGIWTLSMQ